MDNAELIARAKSALERVTEGPWEAALERGCHGVIAHVLPEGGANFVAMVGNDQETPEREPIRFANARFIAEARDLVPALIAALKASEARVKVLEGEQDRLIYVLAGVAGAIDTGRNEPLAVWRDQIRIALDAMKGGAK